jgi:hypothetical protein
MIKTNMHKLDRIMRLLFSVIVGAYIFQTIGKEPTAFRDILMYLAFIFGVTGAINYCPMYKVFGIDTSKSDDEN